VKILLAIDGSKFSEAAVKAVLARALPHNAKVRILHVVEPPSLLVAREMGGYDRELDAVWEAETRAAKVLVTKVAERLRKKGLNVTVAVERGDPRSKILEMASKWRADLIVVGSHGHKGLAHFLLGSVSGNVAEHAGCSVEIVRIPSKR